MKNTRKMTRDFNLKMFDVTLAELRDWVPSLDLVRPINEESIRGFRNWVRYNSFMSNSKREDFPDHLGLDFISYNGIDGKEHRGLSEDVDIVSIADGVISAISRPRNNKHFREYQTCIVVTHSERGLASGYGHVVPEVRVGQRVKKGQRIAHVYQVPQDYLPVPPHLHFEMGKYNLRWELPEDESPLGNHVDPELILPNEKKLFRSTRRRL